MKELLLEFADWIREKNAHLDVRITKKYGRLW